MKIIAVIAVAVLLAAALMSAQQPSRFWSTDWSDLGQTQHAYLVHDAMDPDRCVLVIQTNQAPMGYMMQTATAVPWSCGK